MFFPLSTSSTKFFENLISVFDQEHSSMLSLILINLWEMFCESFGTTYLVYGGVRVS